MSTLLEVQAMWLRTMAGSLRTQGSENSKEKTGMRSFTAPEADLRLVNVGCSFPGSAQHAYSKWVMSPYLGYM